MAAPRADAGAPGEVKTRALLQPLRDLATNWNIDVAKELEDYMEELETLKISFDGGRTTLNFAEAALLIQGSATVYSRKVEFLYSLIYQTLDLLHAQNRRHKRLQNNEAGGAAENLEDAQDEAEDEFLLLDDVVKEGRNIDLLERPEDVLASAALSAGLQQHQQQQPGAAVPQTARAAVLAMQARTPLARMASSRFERHDSSGSGAYRIATLSVSKSGALVMGGGGLGGLAGAVSAGGILPSAAGAALLDLSLPGIDATHSTSLPHDATFASGGGGVFGVGARGAAMSAATPHGRAATPAADRSASAAAAAAQAAAMADDDRPHEEYFGEGAGDYDYYADAGAQGGGAEVPAAQEEGAAAPTAAPSARRASGRRGSSAAAAPAAAARPAAKATDPWLPLDPDAVPRGALRPFKAGRTHLVLRDPRAVAARGPLVAAAEAMAEAAAARVGGSSSGLTVAEARQLKARAEGVAVRAAALHAAAAAATTTSGGPRLVPPLAALSMAGVLLPPEGLGTTAAQRSGTWDGFAIPRGTAPSSVAAIASAAPVFAEAEALCSALRAGVSRARLARTRLASRSSARAAMAGVAFISGEDADAAAAATDEWAAVQAEGVPRAAAARTPAKSGEAPAGEAPAGAAFDDDDRPRDEYFGEGAGDYDYYADAGAQGDGAEVPAGGAGAGLAHWLDDPHAATAAATASKAASSAAGASMGALGGGPSLAERVREAQRAIFASFGVEDDGTLGLSDDDDGGYRALVERYMHAIRANIASAKADVQDGIGVLHMRVDEWQDRLRPVLEAEEARPEFDIANYGRGIVGRLGALVGPAAPAPAPAPAPTMTDDADDADAYPSGDGGGSSRTFGFSTVLPPGAPRYEVCRAFLATLQLANAGNVEIVPPVSALPPPSQQQSKRGSSKASRKQQQQQQGPAAAKAASAAGEADEAAWAFTQAVVYDGEGDVPDAVMAAAAAGTRAAEQQRYAAAHHAGGGGGGGAGAVCGSHSRSFSLRLLSTHLPATFDADAAATTAASADAAAAAVAPPPPRAAKPKKATTKARQQQQQPAEPENGGGAPAPAIAAAEGSSAPPPPGPVSEGSGPLRRTLSGSSNRGGGGGGGAAAVAAVGKATAEAPGVSVAVEAALASPAHKRSRPAA